MTEEQATHPLEQYRGEHFVSESGEARIPTPAEFEDARFAPGTAADLPYAVLYQGEFETPWDGTGTAVRRHARALASTGLPVKLTSISHVVVNEFGYPDPVHEVGLPREIELEVGDLCKTNATGHVPVIKHAVVRNAEHAHNLLVPRGAVPPSDDPLVLRKLWKLVAGSTILYSVWERDRVDVETVRELNRAGQLWVPCRQNAEMLVSSGVDRERVFVVPHPYDPDDDLCKVAALKRLKASEHAHGWRLFYSIGRWEPRKGYAELIEAFLRAFTPDDRVKLTIKYTGGEWQGYPTPTEAVARALAAAPHWTAKQAAERIVLLSGRGPRTGIIELHYRNNIYVASSHGEAWCAVAGTSVDTLNGPRAIQDVKVGDEVFSHAGVARAVTGVMDRRYKGQVIQIRPHGLSHALVFTPEHRHYVVRRDGKRFGDVQLKAEFRACREIEAGDFWVVPKRKPLGASVTTLRVSEVITDVKRDGNSVVCGHSYGAPPDGHSLSEIARVCRCSFQLASKALSGKASGPTARRVLEYAKANGIEPRSEARIPDRLELTPDFMFFLGHYLAEGWADRSTVGLATHAKETAGREISVQAVREAFGIAARNWLPRDTVGRVSFANATVGRFLRVLCGASAREKHIDARLKRSPNIHHLLRGMFYGDGCASDGRYKFSTSSARLAADIVEVCNRLGIFACKAVRERRGKSEWEVSVASQHAETFWSLVKPMKYGGRVPCHKHRGQSFLREDAENFYLPIQSVKAVPYDGTVYNLSVLTDESYTVSGYATHNCLPAFEARMAGNALVAVPYGGVCDFMPADGDPALSIVEPSGLEPVDGSYRWPEGSEWCAFSVEALGEALRRAQAPKQFQFAAELGQFEMRRVGVQMRDLVLALASKVKEEAAEFYKGKLR